MKSDYSLTRNQLIGLCSLCFLVPALRLFPASAAELAGRACSLAAPASLPLLLAYVYFLSRLMQGAGNGRGLGELCLDCLGPGPGKGLLFLFALWYVLYGAFVLRTGADRLITTVYPYASPRFFVVTTGLLSLLAALCPARTLVRTAKLALPAVLGFLFLILVYSLFSVNRYNLMPVGPQDLVPVLKASVSAVNVSVGVLYTGCFLAVKMGERPLRFSPCALWLLFATVVLTALNVAICGSFGPALTGRLAHPFFSLVRGTVFFKSVERVEALVVSLWLFPDFLVVGLVLFAGQYCLRLALGMEPAADGGRLLDVQGGRWLIWLCGLGCILLGVFLAPSPSAMDFWSKKIIPWLNLGFAFLIVPLIYIVGKWRNRL